MKINILIVLFFVFSIAKGQDTLLLKQNVYQLNESLIAKDTLMLKQLLHPNINFGHSNGWVQNFNDVFVDMQTGKLNYAKISTQIMGLSFTKNWAVCTSVGEFIGNVNGNNFSLKLHVMQTWVWNKNKWKLISRQSTKL